MALDLKNLSFSRQILPVAALLGLAGPPGGEPPMPAGAAGLPET